MAVGEYALYGSYRPPTNGERSGQLKTPGRDSDAVRRAKENPPSFRRTGRWLHQQQRGDDCRDEDEEGQARDSLADDPGGRDLFLGLEVSLRFLLALLGPESVVLVLAVA